MENNPIISFKEADIINGENIVLYGLDMDIFPGDFVYIVGKVGTGKTSIIRTMIAENPSGKAKEPSADSISTASSPRRFLTSGGRWE